MDYRTDRGVHPKSLTLVESGYPGMVVIGWNGLLAPTGTPPDIVNKLSREIGLENSQ